MGSAREVLDQNPAVRDVKTALLDVLKGTMPAVQVGEIAWAIFSGVKAGIHNADGRQSRPLFPADPDMTSEIACLAEAVHSVTMEIAKPFMGEPSRLTLADFSVGDRVILSRVRHADYHGKHGTVRRVLKGARELQVEVDGMPGTTASYRALPENVTKE